MKKVLIVCVNYNSYKELQDYLQSIETSANEVKEDVYVEVAVADNTPVNYKGIDLKFSTINIRLFPYHKNLGYMGGAEAVFKDLGKEYVQKFDFVIVSNVDLTLSRRFFNNLCNREFSNDIGWIAPTIYRQDKSNENPFKTERISRLKMNVLILMYSFPRLYEIYERYSRAQHREYVNYPDNGEYEIYAGMGPIFIFTKKFIEIEYPLSFPSFMYGEEIYYGELVKQNNLKTIFVPSIEVFDIGSVSTGKLGMKWKCKSNKESLMEIKKLFYPPLKLFG